MTHHDTADMDKHTDEELREGIEKAEHIDPPSDAAAEAQQEQKAEMESELSERQQDG
jgi:hypothetical protein